MKVKVLKCSNNFYNNLVGKTIEVSEYSPTYSAAYHKIKDDNYFYNEFKDKIIGHTILIKKSDCEIITERNSCEGCMDYNTALCFTQCLSCIDYNKFRYRKDEIINKEPYSFNCPFGIKKIDIIKGLINISMEKDLDINVKWIEEYNELIKK